MSDPQPLDYAPPPRVSLRRRLLRWTAVVALLAVVVAGWWSYEPIWAWMQRRAQVARAAWVQPDLMTFDRPADTLVVDGLVTSDPWSVSPRPGDPGWEAWKSYAKAIKTLPPVPDLDTYSSPIGGRVYLSSAETIFMHERLLPSGESRLVVVALRSMGGLVSLDAIVLKPGSLLFPPRHLTTHSLYLTPFGEVDAELRLFAGQVDPADDTAMTIALESGGVEGTLRLTLGNDDRLHVSGRNITFGMERASSDSSRVSSEVQFSPGSFTLDSLRASDARMLRSPLQISGATHVAINGDRITLLTYGALYTLVADGDRLKQVDAFVPEERAQGRPVSAGAWGGGLTADGQFALVMREGVGTTGWLRMYEVAQDGQLEQVHALLSQEALQLTPSTQLLASLIDEAPPASDNAGPHALYWRSDEVMSWQPAVAGDDAAPRRVDGLSQWLEGKWIEFRDLQFAGRRVLIRLERSLAVYDLERDAVVFERPRFPLPVIARLSPDGTKLAMLYQTTGRHALEILDLGRAMLPDSPLLQIPGVQASPADRSSLVQSYPMATGVSNLKLRWSGDGSTVVVNERDGRLFVCGVDRPAITVIVPPEPRKASADRFWPDYDGRRVFLGLPDRSVLVYTLNPPTN